MAREILKTNSNRRSALRGVIDSYVRAGRHLESHHRAKSIKTISQETGASVSTVRRWLERDHYNEWFRWWPSEAALAKQLIAGRPTPVTKLALPDPAQVTWDEL